MLVFSAICPHPPILIPTIGKDNLDKIKNTAEAMKKLETDLYASKPDIIIVISPHGEIIPDAFCLNLNTKYNANFEQFGDFTTKMEFRSSSLLAMKIKERIEGTLPIVLTSIEQLDHGIGVPLFYLTKHLKGIEILPICYSFLDYQSHFEFGQLLKKEIAKSEKRIAVIASGDMSHALTEDAPARYSPKGAEFDKKFIQLLQRKDVRGIIKMDPKLIDKAAECGLRSFIILLGILDEYKYEPEVYSYEGPFGVGYLVANFKFL
ncbi:AmmeMemoRadiSam system protein B [Candidatus Falkowbacteria bacterium]|nr:AmmeMemoRadiSam system protein B [Candidatus Falkowbacteria bacterium]